MGIDKEKTVFSIHDASDVAQVMVHLSTLEPTKEHPYTVTIAFEDEARSVKQNRLAFLWYRIIGSMTGHGKEHERQYCKLHHGCPILIEEDSDFAQFYGQAIDPLTYELKLASMDYVPVTRLMKVRQFSEYLQAIDDDSAARGIALPHPEDLYWDALMKEAMNHE